MVQRLITTPNTRDLTFYFKQDGVDTPPPLRKPGLWPVNPYVMRRYEQLQNTCGLQYGGSAPGYGYYIDSFVSFTHSLTYPTSSDMVAKLGEVWRSTDLSIGMYLSPEGRESVEMSIDLLRRMAQSARSLKRGDFGGFVRQLDHLPKGARRESARAFNQGDISSAFLSAHLGWEPLIKDTWNLAENIKPVPQYSRIFARKKGSFKVSLNNSYAQFQSVKQQGKASSVYEVDPIRPPTWAERFGMENPFLIAWGLMPLSFVGDYFLPIGQTIDNFGIISGLWGSSGWEKHFAHLSYEAQMTDPYNAIGGHFYPPGSTLTRRYGETRFERKPLTFNFNLPLRSANIEMPTSLMKLSTMSALAHQRILSLADGKRRN